MYFLVSKILYFLMEVLGRRRFRQILEAYMSCQYMPQHVLRLRQEEKLKKLIHYAYQNVPFYNEQFNLLGLKPEDIGSIDDLPRIPVLRREDVRKHYREKLSAKNIKAARRILDRTSGSTGSPLYFYRDKRSRDYTLASFILFNDWAGIDPGSSSVHIGAPSQFSLKKWLSDLLQRHYDVSVFEMSDENIHEVLLRIAKRKPDLIEGYGSGIFRLARAVLEHNITIRPKALVSTSDVLPSAEFVEKVFLCPVYLRYGNREMSGALAQGCRGGSGLHVNTELCVLEVVDKTGNHVAPGQRGRILLTDLTNYVMPFIRYDTGDSAVAGENCICGRGFPVIEHIEGRSSDFLRTRRGDEITSVSLGHFLFVLNDYTEFFLNYQAEQKDLNSFVFRFVALKLPTEDTKQRLLSDLKRLLGNEADIELQFVNEIPLERSGKQVVIKSMQGRS